MICAPQTHQLIALNLAGRDKLGPGMSLERAQNRMTERSEMTDAKLSHELASLCIVLTSGRLTAYDGRSGCSNCMPAPCSRVFRAQQAASRYRHAVRGPVCNSAEPNEAR